MRLGPVVSGGGVELEELEVLDVLDDELGVEPDVETRTLYERIRAEEFTPATRDAGAPRHNLPAPLSPFVGREAELAERERVALLLEALNVLSNAAINCNAEAAN